jgi:hypothetical protein
MSADSGARGKFSRKLLAIIVIIIVVVAVVVSAEIYLRSSSASKSKDTLPTVSLTLVAANGTQKVLNSGEFYSLGSYTAAGGLITEAGNITVGNYTGVPILTLLNIVGGITDGENVTAVGSDGYKWTFTYEQMQGLDVGTYNSSTGAPVTTSQPLTFMAAYYVNGTTLPSGTGPLTVAIVDPQGLITPGAYWVHSLVEIEIIPA